MSTVVNPSVWQEQFSALISKDLKLDIPGVDATKLFEALSASFMQAQKNRMEELMSKFKKLESDPCELQQIEEHTIIRLTAPKYDQIELAKENLKRFIKEASPILPAHVIGVVGDTQAGKSTIVKSLLKWNNSALSGPFVSFKSEGPVTANVQMYFCKIDGLDCILLDFEGQNAVKTAPKTLFDRIKSWTADEGEKRAQAVLRYLTTLAGAVCDLVMYVSSKPILASDETGKAIPSFSFVASQAINIPPAIVIVWNKCGLGDIAEDHEVLTNKWKEAHYKDVPEGKKLDALFYSVDCFTLPHFKEIDFTFIEGGFFHNAPMGVLKYSEQLGKLEQLLHARLLHRIEHLIPNGSVISQRCWIDLLQLAVMELSNPGKKIRIPELLLRVLKPKAQSVMAHKAWYFFQALTQGKPELSLNDHFRVAIETTLLQLAVALTFPTKQSVPSPLYPDGKIRQDLEAELEIILKALFDQFNDVEQCAAIHPENMTQCMLYRYGHGNRHQSNKNGMMATAHEFADSRDSFLTKAMNFILERVYNSWKNTWPGKFVPSNEQSFESFKQMFYCFKHSLVQGDDHNLQNKDGFERKACNALQQGIRTLYSAQKTIVSLPNPEFVPTALAAVEWDGTSAISKMCFMCWETSMKLKNSFTCDHLFCERCIQIICKYPNYSPLPMCIICDAKRIPFVSLDIESKRNPNNNNTIQ